MIFIVEFNTFVNINRAYGKIINWILNSTLETYLIKDMSWKIVKDYSILHQYLSINYETGETFTSYIYIGVIYLFYMLLNVTIVKQ